MNTLAESQVDNTRSAILKNQHYQLEYNQAFLEFAYSEFLSLLLEDEADQRLDNRRKRLYQDAKLPFEKSAQNYFLLDKQIS